MIMNYSPEAVYTHGNTNVTSIPPTGDGLVNVAGEGLTTGPAIAEEDIPASLQGSKDDAKTSLSKFETDKIKSQKKKRKYTMRSDLEEMMFGFGDVWPAQSASLDLLEAITTNYIEDLTMRAVGVSEMRAKLDKECFLYVVRKDRRLFNRAARLLKSHEEIKRVQKETLAEDAP